MTRSLSDRLIELAGLCEKAEGPDRELDVAIKEAVGHSWDYAADWGGRSTERPVANPYTASLDAAMSLVPGDWRVGLLGEISGQRWHCSLHRRDREVGVATTAKTGPLAVAAAALSARSMGEPA